MVRGSVHFPELHGMTHTTSSLLQVAPLWFMAQFTFNTSLSRTTVSSNTILASTASLVTYIMSCLLLGEAFLVVKLASILVCMAGQQSKSFQVAFVTNGSCEPVNVAFCYIACWQRLLQGLAASGVTGTACGQVRHFREFTQGVLAEWHCGLTASNAMLAAA